MLKRTALDRFRATPFPPLQSLGDNPSFTGAPGPEFLQEEPEGFTNAEPKSTKADISRETVTIEEWDFVSQDIHSM